MGLRTVAVAIVAGVALAAPVALSQPGERPTGEIVPADDARGGAEQRGKNTGEAGCPLTTRVDADNSAPEALASAKARGIAAAARDIDAGKLRILYGGPPGRPVKPPVDRRTGYPMLKVQGCLVGRERLAELAGYNEAMRVWHARSVERAATRAGAPEKLRKGEADAVERNAGEMD